MKQKILYIVVPDNNISPFDVTLAADSGYQQILPFTDISKKEVIPLIQDAIFSRPPKCFNDTGIFIGGRDVHLATDMFNQAEKAMVGDFEVNVFVDPNGAYTTAASIIALVEKSLRDKTGKGIENRKVSVFGVGPVGLSAAVLAKLQGADIRLCQLTADDDKQQSMRFCERYGIEVEWASAQTHGEKVNILKSTEVVICAAKAGIRILNTHELAHAKNLILAADTNAVPPAGVSNIEAQDMDKTIVIRDLTFSGIGPLSIGNLKYKTQLGLFMQMQSSEKATLIDFKEAFKFALMTLDQEQGKKDAA